jgi:uncharacterized protein (TIRG00374 family)
MRALRVWAGVAVSVVALFFAFRGVDFRAVGRSLLEADYLWLAVSVLLVSASILVRARRWQSLFAEPRQLHLSRLFGVLNVGYLVNNILPLRAGELARVVLLPRVETVAPIEALSTIVVERVVDTLAVILLLGAVAPLVPVPRSAARPVALLAAAMLLFAALLLIAATRRAATLRLVALAARILPQRFRAPAERHADAAIDGLAALRSPRAALEVAVLSVLVYLLLGAAMAAQLAAFHVQLSLASAFFLLAAATLGLVIPSSPGAVGVWEGIVIGALTGIFSIDRSPATAVALVSHVVFFAPPMFFGAFYLSRFGLSLGRVLGLSERRANAETAGAAIEEHPRLAE